jgi:hypothetical protein
MSGTLDEHVSESFSPGTRLIAERDARRSRPWLTVGTWVPLLVLAILPFVLFAPATFMWRVFAAQDVQAYFYPYHVVSARILSHGHLPLWNPYVFSGIPLLGDGQTALLYPPNWLFFVVPAETALNLVTLLQFSVAGISMYAFARRLGLDRLPAFTASLAYMFGGAVSARIVHLSNMGGAALAPAVLACVDGLLESTGKRARRWCVLAALVLAAQLATGHPQVPVYTALAVALYVLIRGWERRVAGGDLRSFAGRTLLVAGAYVIGYSLIAVQLVPWIEFAGLSVRAATAPYRFIFGTSTTGAEWLLFLFPYLLGAHSSSPFAAGPLPIDQAVRVWEHSAYVGMLPLGLALVGAGHLIELAFRYWRPDSAVEDGAVRAELRRRTFSLVFLVLLLALGLVLAAGWYTPVSRLVYAVPLLGKLRAVERALVLAALALTLLCGFGLQRATEDSARRAWLLVPAILLIAVPALFVIDAQARPSEPFFGVAPVDLARFSMRLPHTFVPLLFAGVAATLLAWWSRAQAGRLSAGIAIGCVLLDVALYATSVTPPAPRRLYRTRPQVLQELRPDTALFRKATVLTVTNDMAHRESQHALAMSWGMVHGIEDVNGFNSLQPRRYTDYLFGPRVSDVSYGYLRDARLFRPENPVLSSLNVRYVLVPAHESIALGAHLRPVFENAEVRMYENTLAYPRAYFALRVRAEADPGAILRQVTAAGFDGRRDVLVETGRPFTLPEAAGPATADVRRNSPNELTVVTNTAQARMLVVSEMYFPGWRAFVDGGQVPIHRTNYLFRGVVAPPGQHTVLFVYRPVSAVVGALLSLLAAIVSGILLLRG